MKASLPTIIAGPILRHTCANELVLWLASKSNMNIEARLFDEQQDSVLLDKAEHSQRTFCVGKHCYIHLISISGDAILNPDKLYFYDLVDMSADESESQEKSLLSELSEILYKNCALPNFRLKKQIRNLAQGSCRKPHFDGKDALVRLDTLVEQELAALQCDKNNDNDLQHRPDMMLMTGDQVYVDDVAGPMLHAIHQVIELLGLHTENFEGATVDNLEDLIEHPDGYYQREQLLPAIDGNDKLEKAFFSAKRKPVFTSVNAKNHLIALSEMLAMYLLCWSPVLWRHVSLEKKNLAQKHADIYHKESKLIQQFVDTLGQVRRALAHVPQYMIFDDHDVTDDWNLTRGWEEQVYGHKFSKRIIGNAMAAYFLCQGCGNPKEKMSEMFRRFDEVFSSSIVDANTKQLCAVKHEDLIEFIFDFDQWHYQLDTSPPIHVLDTRTQRWRSESSLNKPSGLMDWEALCELQQSIIGKESVIMVSAAPVYGVKFIEMVQKIFTIFGGALTVDAENWMAHRGTASVMLNIFRHIKTPPNFIILSGDVHYSFVYDVKLRFRRNSPKITQFTSSGIHNEFPAPLLRWFDNLNRWFYGHNSPLNWLTKRRNMSVRQRQPEGKKGKLVNQCNIGLLSLNEDASEVDCRLLCSDGRDIHFKKTKASK
ncbi:alkaline phosphatase D family protein [Glaciecola sp. MH2013]|uniref:alkaline phosphatase D family protein n=1 Tax=Glaciecola sp. MH2013 TaxID=2785524 RepID=UPI00189EE669|nr:alkaline phosphatase D family protein [Glaciecola sp. MH2013]MBF7074994.1 alkaline phosphatase D family protein [Glaciecola sp. MH2013]